MNISFTKDYEWMNSSSTAILGIMLVTLVCQESSYSHIKLFRTGTPINTKRITKVSDWTKPENYGLE